MVLCKSQHDTEIRNSAVRNSTIMKNYNVKISLLHYCDNSKLLDLTVNYRWPTLNELILQLQIVVGVVMTQNSDGAVQKST